VVEATRGLSQCDSGKEGVDVVETTWVEPTIQKSERTGY
jgi:hypothetical protein